jgi:uncharacterized protein (TIGR02270 family)
MKPLIIEQVLSRHAEEAAFLWLLRDQAVRAPHYTLAQVAELDQRVEAHIDGLRVARNAGWDMCLRAMEEGGAGDVFAATVLAFEDGDAGRNQTVLKAGTATPQRLRGLVSALGWLPPGQALPHLQKLHGADSPVLRRVGVAALAIHRRNPGPALQAAFGSDDPALKARALRAIGELGLVDLHITARSSLKTKDPACRFWGTWSNALLSGHKDAVAYLQNVAEAGGPFAERAAQMAMRQLAPKDAKMWLIRLVKELGQKRIALIAAGAFADPEAIPFLMEQMKVPKLARVAGESFSLITGARLDYDKLEGAKPEGFEAGPTDNPEDENVEMDPDDNLPWPDPALVQKWWNARRGSFAKGTRYLLGQPITTESLRLALKNGYQRQRAAAALELAILKPGRPLFEVRAPGFRQQKLLS